jgi:hypothetical protein
MTLSRKKGPRGQDDPPPFECGKGQRRLTTAPLLRRVTVTCRCVLSFLYPHCYIKRSGNQTQMTAWHPFSEAVNVAVVRPFRTGPLPRGPGSQLGLAEKSVVSGEMKFQAFRPHENRPNPGR